MSLTAVGTGIFVAEILVKRWHVDEATSREIWIVGSGRERDGVSESPSAFVLSIL